MSKTRHQQATAPAVPTDETTEATATVRTGNPDFSGTRCGVTFMDGTATGVAATTAALLASEYGCVVIHDDDESESGAEEVEAGDTTGDLSSDTDGLSDTDDSSDSSGAPPA
ncbi:MAG: hypothetical protein IAE99_08235 [Rhodothermales bacterium]|nr:hypothetical protein [Rhodothermales bacterium]